MVLKLLQDIKIALTILQSSLPPYRHFVLFTRVSRSLASIFTDPTKCRRLVVVLGYYYYRSLKLNPLPFFMTSNKTQYKILHLFSFSQLPRSSSTSLYFASRTTTVQKLKSFLLHRVIPNLHDFLSSAFCFSFDSHWEPMLFCTSLAQKQIFFQIVCTLTSATNLSVCLLTFFTHLNTFMMLSATNYFQFNRFSVQKMQFVDSFLVFKHSVKATRLKVLRIKC